MLKACTKCGESKSLEDFYPAKGTPTGRKARCKVCCRVDQMEIQAKYKAEHGVWKTHTYSYDRQCEQCGGNFTTKTPKTRFCSTACHNKTRRWTLTCRGCGETYEAGRAEAFWCSDACRASDEVAQRARRLLAEQAERAPFAQVAIWDRPEGWARPRYVSAAPRPLRKRWYAGQCACCGAWFIHDQPATSMCSPRCTRKLAKLRRRAVQKAAFVAPVSPRKIFERDGWKCRLCGRVVKRDAVAPHPKAPVIDHIVPLEPLPGQPRGTHEPANVQCAHFLCNSIKGNRGGGEQLLLIG